MKNRGKMVTKLCGFVMSASLLMSQAVYASGEIAGEALSGEVQSAEVQEEIMNSNSDETLPEISQNLSEAENESKTEKDANETENTDLEEESKLDIGGYKITLIDNQVVVDRKDVFVTKANLFNTDSQAGTTFKTPKLKDGNHVDIYVDDQVIEVYVNNGEYVLSNIVYYLKDEFECENVDNLKIYQI